MFDSRFDGPEKGHKRDHQNLLLFDAFTIVVVFAFPCIVVVEVIRYVCLCHRGDFVVHLWLVAVVVIFADATRLSVSSRRRTQSSTLLVIVIILSSSCRRGDAHRRRSFLRCRRGDVHCCRRGDETSSLSSSVILCRCVRQSTCPQRRRVRTEMTMLRKDTWIVRGATGCQHVCERVRTRARVRVRVLLCASPCPVPRWFGASTDLYGERSFGR